MKIHTYPTEKLFTPGVSRLHKENGINGMKDLLYFDNIYKLTLLFPNKERLYYYFYDTDKFKKEHLEKEYSS